MPDRATSAEQTGSRQWAQAGMGRGWQYRFFYWLMRIGGKQRGYHLSYIVTFWYVLFYPSIRRRCRFYLDRRFPERRGRWRRFWDTYRLVRSYGATLVDMLVTDMLGREAVAVRFANRERLLELTAGERGIVLLHGHVGGWQASMAALGEFGKRVSVVMIPELMTQTLIDPAVGGVIDPRTGPQGVMQMTEALMSGEIVAMMGDRTFGSEQNVAAVEFMGGRMMVPITPYRLASATGMAVVVMTAPKVGKGYVLRVSKVIEVPAGLGRNAISYAPYAQQFAACMEEFVGEFPWQFYNFYDLWRDAGRVD